MMKVGFRWNIWNSAVCFWTCWGWWWQGLGRPGAIILRRKHTSESTQIEWERERPSWMNMMPRTYRRSFGQQLMTGCHFSLGFNLHDLLHVQNLPVFVRQTRQRIDEMLTWGVEGIQFCDRRINQRICPWKLFYNLNWNHDWVAS